MCALQYFQYIQMYIQQGFSIGILLLNSNRALFELYRCANKLFSDKTMMASVLY